MKKILSSLLVAFTIMAMAGASQAGSYTGTILNQSTPISGNFNMLQLSDGRMYMYYGPTGNASSQYKASASMPALMNDLLIHRKVATFLYGDDTDLIYQIYVAQ